MLIVQGELDTQVEPSNADRLAELASKRKNAPPAQVVKVPGVNHLLVPATTGEARRIRSAAGQARQPDRVDRRRRWLQKTLGAVDSSSSRAHTEDYNERDMWVLNSVQADSEPFTFRIPPGAIKTVGRASRADFIVDVALVSRLHCRLTAADTPSRSST